MTSKVYVVSELLFVREQKKCFALSDPVYCLPSHFSSSVIYVFLDKYFNDKMVY